MTLVNEEPIDLVETQEELFNILLQEAHKLGWMEGYRDGYDDGVEDTTEHYKPVFSDGLRAKSSLAGKEMQKLKNK